MRIQRKLLIYIKFMTQNTNDHALSTQLVKIIQQQPRHHTSVIIATQGPQIPPQLLDLASFTIIHGFTSPAWMSTLSEHIAGFWDWNEKGAKHTKKLLSSIINLGTGEALLFCPSAMIDHNGRRKGGIPVMQTLGMACLKIKVRSRFSVG